MLPILVIRSFVLFFPIAATIAIETTTHYIKLETAVATSVANVTVAGGKQYAAENALSRGSQMWCSAGNHAPNQVRVTHPIQ